MTVDVYPPTTYQPKAYDVYSAYVLREPCKKSWLSKTAGDGRGGWGTDAPIRKVRVGPDESGRVLLSYERWPVAIWTQRDQLLLNGADGPSVTTRNQQRELRRACTRVPGLKYCLIPFPALAEAGWSWEELTRKDFQIIATTEDRNVERWVRCRFKHCSPDHPRHKTVKGVIYHKLVEHFLGETFFRVDDEYFVCGFDRNDSPHRRMFYLARMPATVSSCTTVDAALACLRPPSVPAKALRQGEWYFIPAKVKPPKAEVFRSHTWDGRGKRRGVPILSATGDRYSLRSHTEHGLFMYWNERNRHVATRLWIHADAIYVSGMVRDEQHDALKLGDGKQWFKVVKNLAQQGWRLDRSTARAD